MERYDVVIDAVIKVKNIEAVDGSGAIAQATSGIIHAQEGVTIEVVGSAVRSIDNLPSEDDGTTMLPPASEGAETVVETADDATSGGGYDGVDGQPLVELFDKNETPSGVGA